MFVVSISRMNRNSKKATNSSTLSMSELAKMAENALPFDGEKERSKKEVLHAMSCLRAEKWGNTISALRTKKISEKKAAKEAEEVLLRELDEKEAMQREQRRQVMVARAKSSKQEQSDEIRKFKSKLMMADIVHQRQQQTAITNYQKEMDKTLENKYLQQTLRRMSEFDDKEQEKKKLSQQKQMETQKVIEVQLIERRESRKKEKLEKEDAAEYLKEVALEMERQHMAKEQQTVDRLKRVQKEQVLWQNEENQRKEMRAKHEQMENEKIQKYQVERERIAKMRKQKEKDRFMERQQLRQNMIDSQIENLENLRLKANADCRVTKQAEDSAAKRDETEKEKAAKNELLLTQCLEECNFQKKERKRKVADDKREDLRRLREIDLDVNRYKEEEEMQVVGRKEEALKVQRFLRKQMIDKKRRELQQKESDSLHQKQIGKQHQEEREEISQWAKDKIDQYQAMGLNVKHLFKS